MSWMIVSDSSCDIHSIENLAPDTQFATVPLKIRLGEREFVDNSALNVSQMMEAFANYNGRSTTACPSPEEWAEKFMSADQVIALTITHSLSGSYSCACAAKDIVLEDHPEKKIYVIDSLSAGSELTLILWRLNELIAQGLSFEEVCEQGEKYAEECHLVFALASFDNLIKNGRMNRLVGFLAGKMNMRGIGRASTQGTLEMVAKPRGDVKALAHILEEMDQQGYRGQRPVVIGHVDNLTNAELLRHGILAKWPGVSVTIQPCGGLCAFYAQDKGLMIGY